MNLRLLWYRVPSVAGVPALSSCGELRGLNRPPAEEDHSARPGQALPA